MFKFCNNLAVDEKWIDLRENTVAYTKGYAQKVIHRICGKVC
jgi:hypothetical protein